MLPNPLHPAIVHLPLALAMLLPVASIIAWLAIRRGFSMRPTWLWVVGMGVGLFISTWVALETGEEEEDLVERTVAESAIESHEDQAQQLLVVTIAVLVLAVGGLFAEPVGGRARLLTLLATIFVAVMAVRTGASGGELVYVHGAASAYVGQQADTHAAARQHYDDDD